MSSLLAKPVVVRPAVGVRQVVAPKPRFVIMRSTPVEKTAIEQAIKDAKEACEGDSKGECAAAWDTVEELSAAAAHAAADAKANPSSSDPLEKYCDDNPDADECRVYDE